MLNQQEKIRMPRVEGRYLDRLGQWTGWMPLPPHIRQHNWGMTKFEIRISPEECLHQWLLNHSQMAAWCPNCNEARNAPW